MRSLCDDGGEVRFGVFAEPVEEIDHWRWRGLDEYDRPLGRWRRYFGFKQFEFLGGVSESVVFGCALAQIRYASSAFVYAYWPQTKELEEYSATSPGGWHARADTRPEDGRAEFVRRDLRIRITPGARPDTRLLRAEAGQRLVIEAEWDESDPPTFPLRICTRAGAAGWVFARKTAGQRVRGVLRTPARCVDLAAYDTRGHRDWSGGYMRRETFWNWGCLAGRSREGDVLGLNVSCGVNETSYTENCFWHNGQVRKLDLVAFQYSRADLQQPWSVTSADGACALRFEPEACHRERMRLGVLGLNFYQLIGRYTGVLHTADGRPLRVERQLGYAEWQYAKW